MLLRIVALLTLLTFAADIVWYRRRVRRNASPLRRNAYLGWIVFTNALPVAIALGMACSRDNTPLFMDFAMWGFYTWLVTVLPRMVYYLFASVRLPLAGLVVSLAIAGAFVWGATLGRTTIVVNDVEICSERLPAAFEGLRIAQFSDMHLGSLVRPEAELMRIVEAINDLNPDLIVFSGDLVNIRYTELDTTAMRILATLRAPYGVISVTGNHDVGTYVRDKASLPPEQNRLELIRRERAMGWRVLEDSTVYLRRGSDSISVSGVSFDPALRDLRHAWELPGADLGQTYAGVPDSLYNITVAHLPQLWEPIREAGYGDLTLSGHVHSMQFKLHLLGWVWSPAEWLYARWSGRYDEQGSTLYINDGTGYVLYPMRLGAYPEITLFTLNRCE